MPRGQIKLGGVCVNNLRDVDLTIPHGQWLTLCGVSGSGKSSLAIDTLYAEGQRRYLESLSKGKRHFLQPLDRPDAEILDGIPPAIALQVARGTPARHTTVGTATDIDAYLQVLFAKAAQPVCDKCDRPIERHHPESVTQWLTELPRDMRFMVAFEPPVDGEAEPLPLRLLAIRRAGFSRVILGDATLNLGQADLTLDAADEVASHSLRVIVDRLTPNSDTSRIRDSVTTAFQHGAGTCHVLVAATEDSELVQPKTIDGRLFESHAFSQLLRCAGCGLELPQPEPKLFDRRSPRGQCQTCEGLGLVDNGVCQPCQGSGLQPAALSFRLLDRNWQQWGAAEIADRFASLEQGAAGELPDNAIIRPLLQQIRSRLKFLCEVGLPYLTLDRPARSLSSGEHQRLSLTSILGSTLVNMLYVLDEPSAGLHVHDLDRLIAAIGRLHAQGNTVAVLDHQPTMIAAAQRVVELGPFAGVEGGEVVFDGNLEQLQQPDASLTGEFLAGRRGIVFEPERRTARGSMKLRGASGHNLKDVNVDFPLGVLCVVSGVSGAGKTSLVQNTLYGALRDRQQQPVDGTLPYGDVSGESQIDEIVPIDSSPIGRNARSNPVTYIGAFDEIRRVFADTVDAKTHNIKVNQFSFNVGVGRCEKCEGDGQLTIDMKFMADVHIRCDQCRGSRYREEVLAVKHRGKNIAEVLRMSASSAFTFFRGQPKLQYKLKGLIDVGLGYIQLGQPATTLSSGEAQRLKLAQFLTVSKNKRALFLMDEPTRGLHMADIVRLADCFSTLLSVGHSLIVVEHNLQLMQYADWIIDLGPGAAANGGQVVAEGTPEDIAEHPDSITGRYLKQQLALG